ncbi:zona pellucida sperm-binding protein 3 receptor-like [Sphaerodactylus townsendi]|uniref:zona pellucida sperm-binding protein 3 receptor-like n=1 Tax=Sphaerodactylus townsendi TaxID=933632 RepID=UPI00202765C6|nr:zona pellucida sperm-binding protein 3 receptor-like [Sphaerodactylus townsendi]
MIQASHHMHALQLCLFAAFAAVVHSDCGPPLRLSFATLRNTDERVSYPVGTRVTYRCMPGYEPVPGTRPVITCLETSEWSEIIQFCQGRHCPFPGIENGKIASMTDLRLGDQITFACNEGYRLIGQSNARCMLMEGRVVWSAEPPYCQRVPCFPPPTIPNGKHSGTDRDDYEYGSAVTYNCDSGFSLIGDKTIVCVMDKNDMNGKWSGSAPRCEVIECRGPEISNGRIVSSYQPSYTYGNTVTFECYREYILRGENVIKCEANSTWHPAPPVCALNSCGPPTALYFAELLEAYKNKALYPVDSVVKYQCQPGYTKQSQQPSSITCLRSMKWSNVPVLCKRRSCGDPGKPKNGRLTEPQDFSFGSIIHFICDKGYRLIGQPSIQCVILGQKVAWSGEIPICQYAILHPSSAPSVTSDFSSQEPAVTVATNISILPTLQTELPSGKLFMILQEIKETVNLKAKSLEERLVGLEKKMDKIINEFKPCCQPAKEERLEEENAY